MLEPLVKRALKQYLSDTVADRSEQKVLTELKISSSAARADFVDINAFHCFEIKSSSDSLRRLVSQGARYIKIFDRVTLVTAQKHLNSALGIVPAWWGVLLILDDDTQTTLKELRPAKQNSLQTSWALTKLLRRDECLQILSDADLAKGLTAKSLYQLQEYIASGFTMEQIKQFVKTALLTRYDEIAS